MKKTRLGVTLSLSLSLSAIVVGSLFVATSCKQNKDPSNYVGNWDGKDWKGYQSGGLIVNAHDEMGCSIDSSSSYQANNLVIPDKVKLADNTIRPLTSIGDECFKYDIGLTGHLILNNEVNVIGNYAFYDCKNLSGSLVIPDSVTSIGTQAFCDCSGFLSDVWNDDNKISMDSQNVYYIRHANTYYCLGQCSNVNSSGWEGPVVLSFIEAGTKIIGNSAFHNCTNTSGSPIIPSSVISIGDSAFSYCYSLSGSLTIPNSVIFIGAYAFSSCYGFHNLNFDDFTIAPSWNKESQFSGWSNSGSVTSTGSWSQLEALQYAKDRGLPSDWQ